MEAAVQAGFKVAEKMFANYRDFLQNLWFNKTEIPIQ
jgi:hypothetical protein